MSADRRGVARPDLAAARLYTAVVSDILDGLGYRDHTLDPAIRPLSDAADVVVAGWANPFLVAEAGGIPAEPYTGEIAALDDVARGRSCWWLRAARPVPLAGASCSRLRPAPVAPAAP